MEEKDFQREIELIKEEVSEFQIPYSACQYFHVRTKSFSKEQFDKAVTLFYKILEEKFSQK